MMPSTNRPDIDEIVEEVLDITAAQLNFARAQLSPSMRLVLDLRIDSLDFVELLMQVEERFDVTLPDSSQLHDQFYKQVFTRVDFCLRDLAELVHMRWGSGTKESARDETVAAVNLDFAGFAQLGWSADTTAPPALYERSGQDDVGNTLLRRHRDGMPCVLLPSARVQLGYDGDVAGYDEQPVHEVRLSSFIIDLELVSTTAFCRFLNSVDADDSTLRRWFRLDADDRRRRHELVAQHDGTWQPQPSCGEWPMILVSWYGARAYARWVHGDDPLAQDGHSFLPSEAQWEYATRGAQPGKWPWGDEEPTPGSLRAGRARATRETDELPLGPVHGIDSLSAFGVRGTLGHVWQWCTDSYSPDAYARRDPGVTDPVNSATTQLRSERGGSWVGPVSLCRPSYRRGRAAIARGRCLGFRCAAPSSAAEL